LFHGKDEVPQTLFWGQFGWLARSAMCFLGGPCMSKDGQHNNPCQLKLIQSEIDESPKQTPLAFMVAKTSRTITLVLNNCPLSSSNSTKMKKSQVLTK
jgi:hypothetical protein